MNFIISGKNIDVSDELRNAVIGKMEHLGKYFTDETKINVTLSVEKERQKVEVTIPVRGSIIRTEQVSNDMYVSIDLAEEVLERQILKYRRKIIDRHQGGTGLSQMFIQEEQDAGESEIRIVRTKKFDIKPMYAEDACVEMELVGHSFFVFINADTDQPNVVYKRKDGSYGLIEPEE